MFHCPRPKRPWASLAVMRCLPRRSYRPAIPENRRREWTDLPTKPHIRPGPHTNQVRQNTRPRFTFYWGFLGFYQIFRPRQGEGQISAPPRRDHSLWQAIALHVAWVSCQSRNRFSNSHHAVPSGFLAYSSEACLTFSASSTAFAL